MISVQEATSIIFQHLLPFELQSVPLAQSVGEILAEDLYADRPFPPFHRVTMDGIAIDYKQWLSGQRIFSIAGTQAAGMPPLTLHDPAQAIEVMTGAVLPIHTDTVIRYEDLEILEHQAVVLIETVVFQQNVHRMGSDKLQGAKLLPAGVRLYPSEIGVAATIGKSMLNIRKIPPIAVLSTGDELVEVTATPLPYQIRRSNALVIQAILQQRLNLKCKLAHLMDDPAFIKNSLKNILKKYPIVILSGAVSEGKFDYLPSVLQDLGVKKKFHKVAQRPGKPFWFGTRGLDEDEGAYPLKNVVFALPGNPVSTTVCTYRYVLTWLYQCLGIAAPTQWARLGADFSFQPKLSYFLPVHCHCGDDGVWEAMPHIGQGSGDLSNLNRANGWLELPPEQSFFKKGQIFPFISY